MRYVSLLLAASLGWTAPTFAQSTDEIWQELFAPAPSTSQPSLQSESRKEFLDREGRCLATALYFEGHGWPVRGQVAIAQVILNRVRSPKYPQTICGVVYQGQMTPNCQFHFACDGRSDAPNDDADWALAQSISKKIMAGELWLPEVGYATSVTDPRVAVLAPAANALKPGSPKEGIIATGTGFIVNDRGDVVTNHHVVKGCSRIKFGLYGVPAVEETNSLGQRKRSYRREFPTAPPDQGR